MIPKSCPYLSVDELIAAMSPDIGGRARFESALAKMAGARYGVTFSFAHAGFYALLKVLNLTQTEIILPAYTCDIMAEVIVCTGNIPVFVDIDLADFNMNLDAVKSAITNKTRAIVVTHMFGYPARIDALRRFVGGERIMIIEDAALHLTGSKQLRSDVSLFSFGPGKPLYTVRGGMCITNDAELYEKLCTYRDQYMNRLPFKEWAKRWARLLVSYFSQNETCYDLALQLGLARNGFEYEINQIPDSYDTAYADFQARIGLVLLPKVDMLLAKKRSIVDTYNRRFEQIPGLIPAPIIEGATYSYYTARVKNRDAIQFNSKMYRHRIHTGRTFNYAVPCLERYRSYAEKSFPCAEEVGKEVVNFPIHVTLDETRIDFISDCVRQIFKDR